MLIASSKNFSGVWIRIVQIATLSVATLSVVVFLRFYVGIAADAFQLAFERQNHLELANEDVYMLSRRAAALRNSGQVICVKGEKDGKVFLEEGHSNFCNEGFFRVKRTVRGPAPDTIIEFVLGPPTGVLIGITWFLALQSILTATLVLSEIRLRRSREERELALAIMAKRVAHDIRSPLAILKSISQKAGSADDSGALRSQALARLSNLVDELQGVPTRSSWLTLRKLLEESVESKKQEIQGSCTSLRLHWKIDLGDAIPEGSPDEWRRLISNLLNNAVESGAGAPVQIDVYVDCTREGFALVQVKDTGQGIPSDLLPTIGKKGFTAGKKGGTGLGLFMANEFLKSVGGSLELSSNAGLGTVVNIDVPIVKNSFVVLIDDDSSIGEMWARAAAKRKIAFRYFSSPKDILEKLQSLPTTAAIYLDFNLASDTEGSISLGDKLFLNGFRNIFFATGSPLSALPHPKWLKGIVGKDPPWL